MSKARTEKKYDVYIAEKAVEIGKFQAIKRKFELEFISIVRTNYPQIADDLTETLRNIEDIATGCLDKQDLSIEHFDSLERDINDTKSTLLSTLYRPLVVNTGIINRFLGRV